MKTALSTTLINLLIISFMLNSCGEKDPIMATSIMVNPETVNLMEEGDASIELTPVPAGIADWMVVEKPSWLQLSQSSGTLSGKKTEIKLTANSSGLQPGNYYGELEFMSATAGFASVTVSMTVDAHPVIQLNNQELDFLTDKELLTFTIKNTGTGSLNWEIANEEAWLTLSEASGSLSANALKEIQVNVDRKNLQVGTKNASLTITSNADNGNVLLPVTMEVPEMALISLSEENLLINYFAEEKQITLTNDGNVTYSWTIESDQDYVALEPSTGTLNMGESVTVTLTPIREALTTGDFPASLTVQNNEGQHVQASVILKNYKEEKWLLQSEIKDAEYDKVNDAIVAVSTDMKLLKLDPETQAMTKVTLNLLPKCVSVSRDGQFAAVGHDGKISYVDLRSMSLVKMLDVTADVFDIILAPNGYIYAMPATDQWEDIRCIDIVTGKETLSTGSSVRAGTRMKLHPSGEYIYGADNGISPSDFEKYDIRKGTAIYLYDSPYHGDYAFSGNIWISDDGNRLFAKSRNVFKASADQTLDITYAGSIEGDKPIVALDHSAAANKLVAVLFAETYTSTSASNIRIYDGTYYTLQKTVDFPQFIIPDSNQGGTLYQSEGYFAFINSTGNKFFVLLRNKFNNTDFAVGSFEL